MAVVTVNWRLTYFRSIVSSYSPSMDYLISLQSLEGNTMSATILGQNHSVICYEVNGRKKYIIEDIPITKNRAIVNLAICAVGRLWEDVVNYLQENDIKVDDPLYNCIESMTY
jgi:hypothetical protein